MLPFLSDLKLIDSSPIHVLVGNCRFFKDQAVSRIARELQIPSQATYRLESHYKLAEVKSRLGIRSLMERRRLFVWGEFEKGLELSSEVLQNIKSILPHGHYLILETADRKYAIPEKSLPVFDGVGPVIHCDVPRESRGEVSQWIRHSMLGKEVPESSLQEMAQTYGLDLYLLEAEIEKLRRYPGDLTSEIVLGLLTKTERTDTYSLLDMIALRNTEGALRVLSLLLGGTPLPDILASLSRFLSHLMAVGFLAQKGKDTEAIAEVVGLGQAQVQRLRAAVPRFSVQSLVHALNHLAQIDLASRREGDPESLLLRVVYLLCSNPDSLVVKYRRGLR